MSGKFPYKLLVTINSAENLPIADFTTSDPYVTVTVGEKQIGKTKVVYKNHINPMWQESFSVDLLHHNEKLLLRVCDEDDGQDDDVMGLVTIDLSMVPKNRMINQTRELEQCSNIKARGTLNVSFVLRKVDNIVTITKNELTAKKIGKHVMNVFPAIEEELKMIRLSPAIEYALKAIFSSEAHTPFFSKRLLHDLLMDAKSISSGNAAFALSEEVIHRSDLRLVGASRMDLSSKEFISDAPIEENCIQINLAGTAMGGPPSYVLLQLASRYSVWNWLMWLRVLYDVWSGEMTQKELPAWAAQGFYKGSITILSSSDGQSVRGMCSVSVGDPFNIVCIKRSGGAQIVSLENMVSVVTSVDSFVPDKYALHIALVQSSHSPAALYDAEADLSALEKNAFDSWSMSQRSLPPPPSSSPSRSRLFAATNNNTRRKRGDSEEQEEEDDDTSHADSDLSSPSQHHRPPQQQQGQDRHSWRTNNNDQCSATDGSSVRGDEDEEQQQQHHHQLQEEEEERDSEWEQSSVASSVLPLGIADGEKKKKGLLKRMGRKMKKTVQIVASHAHFSSNNSKLTSQALPPSPSSPLRSADASGEGPGGGSGGSAGNVIKDSKNSHTSQHLAGLHITFECGPMLSHSTRKDHSSGSIYWHDALCIDAPEAEVLGTALAGVTPARAMDIAMFYGIYGMESCRGQLHLPLSRLIPAEERAKPNFLESPTSRIFETEVAITHKTVFSVTLLHAQGLALPAAVIKKGASSSSCTISAKCKLVTGAWKSRVDRSGVEIKSSTKTPLILSDNDNDEGSGIVVGIDDDAASPAGATAGTAASATFQDTVFLLKAPDSSGAHHHQEVVQYLRVELLVSPSAGKKETPVGVAFVPLHTISEQARDVTVELSRFKIPGLDKLQTSGQDRRVQGDLGLGKLSLRCQRIAVDNLAPAASSTSALSRLSLHRNNNNNIVAAASGGGSGGADIHAQNVDLHLQHNSYRPFLKLRTTVREQGVENTLYYCEGILSGGNIDRHADAAEHYLLMAHPDALLLVENSAARERAERIASSSATSVAGAGGGAGKGTSKNLSRRPVSLLQRGVSVGSTGSSGHTRGSGIDDYNDDDDDDNDDGGDDDQSSRSARKVGQEEAEDDEEVDDEEGDDENNDNNDTPRAVVAVFELHHRGTMPPFEWIAGGSHARPQFSDLEAKTRYEFRSIEEAKVPVGYTWLDNNDGSAGWVLDKEYLNTDEEGWIYGSSFAKLLKDSLAGVSSVSPFNHHIRRRKWVRAVRALTVAERDQAVNAFLNGSSNGDDGDDRSAAQETARGSLQHAQSVGMHLIGGVSTAFAIANCAQNLQMMTMKTTTASMDVSSRLEAERKKRGIEWRLARHSRKSESAKDNNNSSSDGKRRRRRKLLQNGGDASDLLALCEEREVSHSSVAGATAANGEGGPIRIPWRNVKSVALVTDSVLCVQAEVQRFFPDPGSRSGTFRPALVDLFVSNCPALHLKSLLQERTIFAQFRECLKQLIKVGTLSGEASSPDEKKGGLASHSGEGHQTGGDLDEGDEDEAVPETEELSFGAELFSDMDHEAVLIEAEIDRLQRLIQRRRLRASAAAVTAAKAAKLAGKPVVLSPEAAVQVADVASSPLVEEISVLVRRLCRLRVYMATLIGAGLRHDAASGGGKSGMSFSLRSAQRNIQRDMQRYQAIDLGNDVLTANNRIEFLLDTAELRIRESAVGGWEHQQLRNKQQQQLQLQQRQQRTRFCVVVEGDEENDDNNNEISGDCEREKKSTGGLEGCIEAYVNGYLTEIAGILGMFFDQKKLENVKGLQSKINLINTFMKHNDRLDDILQGSLQPYGLAPTPAPKLSLFLNFEILLAWYNQILLFEMRERVKEVLAVWRDKEKDVSGQAEHYQYPLAWTPQRLNGDSGNFMTAIPEDTVEFLMTYLSYARIREEDVAPSFRRSIGRLDNKVLLTFASTFLFLSEEYVRALSFKDWTVTCEDELVEYSEWLCSVANDAQRVIDCEMLQPVGMSLSEEAEIGQEDDTGAKLLEVTGRTIAAWDGMRMDALDHLSCLLFTFLFHHYDGYLDPDQFCVVWRKLVLRSHRHHKQQHQQQGLSPQGLHQGKSSAVSTKTTTIASTAKTLKKRASSMFFEQHAANNENGDAEEEEDVCFTDLVNVFIDSLADKADFLCVHCYVQLLQICGGKLATFYLSFLRTSKRHGFYFKPTGPEVRQVGRDINCIKLGFERCLRALSPADRAENHDTVMDIFAVLDHSLHLLQYDLNSPQFVSTLDFFSQYICARPATADAVAELVEHCLGLSGVHKFRDPAGHCNPTTGETVEPVPSVASIDDTPAVFAHQNEKDEVDLELVGQGRHEMHSLQQLQTAHRQEKNDKRRKESFIVSNSYATADHTAAKNASPFTRLGESEADQATTSMMVDSIGRLSDSADTDTDMSAGKNGGGQMEHRTLTGRKNLQAAESLYGSVMQLASSSRSGKNQTISLTHRPPLTSSLLGADLSGSESTDAELRNEAAIMANDVFLMWVFESISALRLLGDDIHGHGHGHWHGGRVRSLIAYTPVFRAFDNTVLATTSLKAHMVQSAFPRSRHDRCLNTCTREAKHGSVPSHHGRKKQVRGGGGFFEALFSVDHKDNNQLMRTASRRFNKHPSQLALATRSGRKNKGKGNGKKNSSSDSDIGETLDGGCHSLDQYLQDDADILLVAGSSSEDEGELLGTIKISDIQAADLFFLDFMSSPKPYLRIDLDGVPVATSSVKTGGGSNACWANDGSGEGGGGGGKRGGKKSSDYEKAYTVGIRDGAEQSSLRELTISLLYKGYLYDQLIGKVTVAFNPYDLPNFSARQFPLDCSDSPRAVAAGKLAEREGRTMPTLTFTVRSS